MKSTIATTAAALLSLSNAVTAAPASTSFSLVLSSNNFTIDGKLLTACHEGADIEGLCINTPNYSTFKFSPSTNYLAGGEQVGTITYAQTFGNDTETQELAFYYVASTNVAHVQFGGAGQSQAVGFDKGGKLFVPTNYDDTVSPPKELDHSEKLYHWQICDYDFEGYQYQSLNWALSHDDKAENPSCQKVEVYKSEIINERRR